MSRLIALVSFITSLCLLHPAFADKKANNTIKLISAELPSALVYKTDGTVEGAYPQFFSEAAKRAGVDLEYRLVPWKRAAIEAQETDDFLIFPLTRNKEREPLYSWVALLRKTPICFVSLHSTVDTLKQARAYKRILVWQGTSHESFLREQDFENLVVVQNTKRIEKILVSSPETIWYTGCLKSKLLTRDTTINERLKKGAAIDYETIWLAGGPNFTMTSTVEKFTKALKDLFNEGLLDKLSQPHTIN